MSLKFYWNLISVEGRVVLQDERNIPLCFSLFLLVILVLRKNFKSFCMDHFIQSFYFFLFEDCFRIYLEMSLFYSSVFILFSSALRSIKRPSLKDILFHFFVVDVHFEI